MQTNIDMTKDRLMLNSNNRKKTTVHTQYDSFTSQPNIKGFVNPVAMIFFLPVFLF